MVAQTQIRQLGTKYQTSELNIMREYLQHLFLNYFYQLPEVGEIYFKGGTALRIIYKSPRFSQDLDFSTNKANIPEIENCLLEVLARIEKENIQAILREATRTSGGYLSTIDFIIFNQTVPIKIEISFREKVNKGEIATINSDFIPSYTLVFLAQEQLISQKMQALMTRKKPRHFYDLYFILRANLLTPQAKEVLPQVLQVLRKTNINFEAELKLFLPKSHWLIIRDFKSTLEQEIRRLI